MPIRTRILRPVLLAVALVLAACGDDDAQDSSATTSAPEPAEAVASGVIQLESLPGDSGYVEALCEIDFFHPGDEDDPMSWVIESLRELPTAHNAEKAEVAWLIERIEASEEFEDPLESDDLSAAAAVLRARCS